ncbi:MAG: tRNA glutamyl-Q(34) synthetase GluQRS [Verrucomicrobia bacterium]|nr:MAG: tRNA glutamyl-Q(34) synthetase GluQRS [Verrucomicrobiota bacterium]
MKTRYAGRLAPSPTGYLHLGHARTFIRAAKRAEEAGGRLLLRIDDLDTDRCRPEFAEAAEEDLSWLGLRWETPVQVQSRRRHRYRAALARLHAEGVIFPCSRSRKDLAAALSAPHEVVGAVGIGGADDEPIYPPEWRPRPEVPLPALEAAGWATNWRFRVPDGRRIVFDDAAQGPQTAEAGRDFGDFLVWRKDGLPSYQLACAVDDVELGITEVVRGADLVRSTFRQLLLWERLAPAGEVAPTFYHVPLLLDAQGQRMAKRHDALALRTLRAQGLSPEEVRAEAGAT